MRRLVFKTSILVAMVFYFVLVLGSCATLFNNKQTTISAASGRSSEVTIFENGSVVYEGPLPAVISVNGSNSYIVKYTDKDGHTRTLQLAKKLSGWFIADLLLFSGWVIDFITGNVMEYGKATTLPIKYNIDGQFLLIDAIPVGLRKDLNVIGNIYR